MDEPNSEPSTSPDTIGNTQLVPLIKVPKHSGMKCQIFAKLEFRNKPSKSIYDRLALALINKAELAGIMEPGSTLIFGPDPEFCFALLNICNSKQYKFLALVPESIVTTTPTPRLVHDLKNFGATIHPIPESFVTSKELCLNEKAQALADSEGGINLIAFVMANDGVFNSEIDQLTQEIEKSEVVPHVFVGELDNLGILDRVSQKLSQSFPTCKIFGVESEVYSIANKWKGFHRPSQHPGTNVVTILERGAFRLARDLNKKEDLYCGERGGAVMAGVLKIMDDLLPEKKHDKDFVIICTLPDSLYHSHGKFLNVDLMREKGYMPEAEFTSLYWWYFLGVGNLTFNTFPSIVANASVKQAASVLKLHPRILVWTKPDHQRDVENILGVLTEDAMKLIEVNYKEEEKRGDISLNDCAEFLHPFGALDCRGKLGELDKILETYPFSVIYNDIFEFTAGAAAPTYFKTPLALVSIKEMNEWTFSVEEHHRLQYGWEPGVGFMMENNEPQEQEPGKTTDSNTNDI